MWISELSSFVVKCKRARLPLSCVPAARATCPRALPCFSHRPRCPRTISAAPSRRERSSRIKSKCRSTARRLCNCRVKCRPRPSKRRTKSFPDQRSSRSLTRRVSIVKNVALHGESVEALMSCAFLSASFFKTFKRFTV